MKLLYTGRGGIQVSEEDGVFVVLVNLPTRPQGGAVFPRVHTLQVTSLSKVFNTPLVLSTLTPDLPYY